ncbi:MAG: leucine--tRNA ligase, partial [Gammaproteobacteria bacterium]
YQDAIKTADDNATIDEKTLTDIRRDIHQSLQQATNDFARQHFNTVVSACMKIYNAVSDISADSDQANSLRREGYRILILLLSPIAPHIAHSLWSDLGFDGELLDTAWPEVDQAALVQSEIELAVQVSGKMRGKITVSVDADQDSIINAALANENVSKFTDGKTVVKTIVVPKKLVNIVVKG